MINHNSGGSSSGSCRLSAGAPDLSGNIWVYAEVFALDKRNGTNETSMRYVFPNAGTTSPFILTARNDGTIRVLLPTNKILDMNVDLDAADMADGTYVPVLVVVRNASGTVTAQAQRIGNASALTASVSGVTGVAGSGEWGLGAASGSMDFWSNTNNRRFYGGACAFRTYASTGNMPALTTLFDAIWNGGLIREDRIIEAGSAWGTVATESVWCGCPITNLSPGAWQGHGVGESVTASGFAVFYAAKTSVMTQVTPTLDGTHTWVDPMVAFPDVFRSVDAGNDDATGTSDRGSGTAPRMRRWLENDDEALVFATGQSFSCRQTTSSVTAVESGERAGNCLWQGVIARDSSKVTGIAAETILKSASDGGGGFSNRDGGRYGFDVQSNSATATTNGSLLGLSTSDASDWVGFGVGEDSGTAGGRLNSAGGVVFVGTANGSDEILRTHFAPFGGIGSTDALDCWMVAMAYPGGPAAVSFEAQCYSAVGGTAGSTIAGQSGLSLDTGGAAGTVDSVTGGTIVSKYLTTADTVVLSGLTESDIDATAVAAWAADPDNPNLPMWVAFNQTTNDIAPISAAVWDGGAETWTLSFGSAVLRGWSRALPSVSDTLVVGEAYPVVLMARDVVDATSPATRQWRRLSATKTGASGGGPAVVVAQGACRAQSLGANKGILGGLGAGGTPYSVWNRATVPGYPIRTAMAIADALAIAPTYLMQMTVENSPSGVFTAQIARLRASHHGAEVVGVGMPVFCASATDLSDDVRETLHVALRDELVAAAVPYVDPWDWYGPYAQSVTRGFWSDANTNGAHPSAYGHAVIWEDVATVFLGDGLLRIATPGGGAARNRSRSRARASAY